MTYELMLEAEIKAIFQINYYTSFGDNIAVIGSHDKLGAWNPFEGLHLTYQGDGNWSSSILLPRTREKNRV